MRTLLVTGSDTGVGKTHVVGALARWLRARGGEVRIVKPVETGRLPGEAGDALAAARIAHLPAGHDHTVRRFSAPLAPLAAAAAEGGNVVWDELIDGTNAVPACDWRIVEGAGGIAVPLAENGADWADFARELHADAVVLVVPDRLGAINQARLTLAYARQRGLAAGLWLNAAAPVDPAVASANRSGLAALDAPLWGECAWDDAEARPTPAGERALLGAPDREADAHTRSGSQSHTHTPTHPRTDAASPVAGAGAGAPFDDAEARCAADLRARDTAGLRRRLRVFSPAADELNLAGNDYLGLARDPVVVAAMAEAAWSRGACSSASPLITGWTGEHEATVRALCAWHGFPEGLLWTSGHAANVGVLGTLPRPGDLVLADRLIHQSMVAGILKSGARLRRYPHLDADALERMLIEERERASARAVFVVTESVFSMDGDHPDLRRFAVLRRRFGFCWIVDEAHALGWFGPQGAGLAEEQGVAEAVDVLIGTGGKALGAGGGYTLFHSGAWRDSLVNHAGEFVYSTALPPPVAAALRAGAARARELAREGQAGWRANSRLLRAGLRAAGWDVALGDSPIVPLRLGAPERALVLADKLRDAGVIVAAVRPPTVPAGTSRLRLSLNRAFDEEDMQRVLATLGPAEGGRLEQAGGAT